MDKHEQIREALREFVKRTTGNLTMLALVDSVDEENYTCTLVDDDLKYYDVRLRPVLDGKQSLTVFPKQGTWVFAIKIEEDDDWMIISTGEADKIRWKAGDAIVEQTAEGLLVQKQTDTLREALILLVEAVQSIIVIEGRNPDRIKLQQSLTKIQNILR